MTAAWDLAVIGAGPAGMAAATQAAALGLSVVLLDEQPAPGGQIYRAVERNTDPALGPDYRHGAMLAEGLRASAASYRPATRVWQVEDGRLYASTGGRAEAIAWRRLILAVGAMERPVPLPGWTLPGVMTVGAAQILLKNDGMLPADGVWIAGSGPLPLLYAAQVAAAGGRLAGFLDTAPPGRMAAAIRRLPLSATGWRYLAKGIGLLNRLGVPRLAAVSAVEAIGDSRVEAVRFRHAGTLQERPASGLLLHEGVVPQTHMTMALGCAHDWDPAQACFRPRLDGWGRTDLPGVLVAGDAGGIGGARAAEAAGRIAALAAAADLGAISEGERDRLAAPHRRQRAAHLSVRPFLDALYPPPDLGAIADEVTVCRCEGVTAGGLRAAVAQGARGPNQAKTFTRAGMGPCQGRLCGLTATAVIARALDRSPADTGFYRIRPPLKPLTLGELASLPGGLEVDA
ncbi:MAG: NAD(P)/FAD-dependent oxidoreductase [Thalassobaculales bacterium]